MILHQALLSACGTAPGGSVSITNQTRTCADVQTGSGAVAVISYQLRADGQAIVARDPEGDITLTGEWLVSGSAADFEARMTLVSGDTPDGPAAGSWVNLGTTRSWEIVATAVAPGSDSSVVVMDIDIRDAATLSVLDTARITLTATADHL